MLASGRRHIEIVKMLPKSAEGQNSSQTVINEDPMDDAQSDRCDICKKMCKDNENAIECEGCNKWQHSECAGLIIGEYNIIKRKTCKLTWLCAECKPKLLRKPNTVEDTIESFTRRIEAVLDFMENKLEEKIRQEIRVSLPGELEKLLPSPMIVRREKSQPLASNTGEGTRDLSPKENESEQWRVDIRGLQETEYREPPILDTKVPMEEEVEDESEQTQNTTNEAAQLWTTVVSKRQQRQNRKITIGTKQAEEDELQAAVKNAWLYVGKLKSSTTRDVLLGYLRRNGITGELDCEELQSKGRMKSFRIGVPLGFLNKVGNAEFWPQGILVRRFDFRRGRYGISLE